MGWLQQLWAGSFERSLKGLDRLAEWRGTCAPEADHLRIGREGEEAALHFLRGKGYIVVAQRWSSGDRTGDVDLIAWKDAELAFVEVKTRTAHDIAAAEVRVDAQKRKVLRGLARRYLRQLPQQTPAQVRFDVISVYLVPGEEKEFFHFENYFGWTEHRRAGD
jgi:putative endonuclease